MNNISGDDNVNVSLLQNESEPPINVNSNSNTNPNSNNSNIDTNINIENKNENENESKKQNQTDSKTNENDSNNNNGINNKNNTSTSTNLNTTGDNDSDLGLGTLNISMNLDDITIDNQLVNDSPSLSQSPRNEPCRTPSQTHSDHIDDLNRRDRKRNRKNKNLNNTKDNNDFDSQSDSHSRSNSRSPTPASRSRAGSGGSFASVDESTLSHMKQLQYNAAAAASGLSAPSMAAQNALITGGAAHPSHTATISSMNSTHSIHSVHSVHSLSGHSHYNPISHTGHNTGGGGSGGAHGNVIHPSSYNIGMSYGNIGGIHNSSSSVSGSVNRGYGRAFHGKNNSMTGARASLQNSNNIYNANAMLYHSYGSMSSKSKSKSHSKSGAGAAAGMSPQTNTQSASHSSRTSRVVMLHNSQHNPTAQATTPGMHSLTGNVPVVSWQVWKSMSKSKFCCNGRIMVGVDVPFFMLTNILLLSVSVVYLSKVYVFEYILLVIPAICLFFFCFFFVW